MIDVVLPVLDEAAALPVVLSQMPSTCHPIVVDNASTDGSAALAAALGATVVREPRRGFGAACFTGLMTARADIVCFMDCDGSLDPRELTAVAGPVLEGRFDLVLGARRPTSREAWPRHARVANKLLGAYMTRRVGTRITDLGPMRAARRLDLLDLAISDRRFGWPLEMVLRAARARWRIGEVSVSYSPRIGASKVTGTLRGTALAIRDMARVRS
jgi:glycosyltransferase involved in cell wall biosynthesis